MHPLIQYLSKTGKICFIFCALFYVCSNYQTNAQGQHTVLVETESFSDYGGWVRDCQFMDAMGSPYLLAHGLGSPVKDAVTTVVFPAVGRYRIFVRTMDWVGRWKATGAPGRFQVFIDQDITPGKNLWGTESAEWTWQNGGEVEIKSLRTTIRLHDLTGFEGRCDALLFTTDSNLTPPNRDPEMASFRRKLLGFSEKPEDTLTVDLAVAGGGMAGTCAAISAARLGLKVALIQDRPVLGGNNSSEVRVWLQGARNKEPWPRVGDVVGELEPSRRAHYGPSNTAELYEDQKKLDVVRAESNIRLILDHRVNGIEMQGQRIKAIIAQDTISGRRIRINSQWYADCTGDGALGFLAGADFDMTPQGHMGPCNLWNVIEIPENSEFPRCPWALDLAGKPFPGRDPQKPDILKLGGWYWESGFDRDPIADMEYVRDWNFRAMYGAWDAIKNVDKTLPKHQLNWAAHILGKRESRRLMGDVILSLDDLKQSRQYPDGCVPTGWKVDLHLPDPRYEAGFEGDAFISKAEFGSYPMPYWVPYRCLYSRNISNLFMAGRDISVTHEALGAVRVMRTGGCMGEIVGMAASVCKKYQADPKAVYNDYLKDLQDIMRRGVGKNPGANPQYDNQGEPAPTNKNVPVVTETVNQEWLKTAGNNLARSAHLTVSSGGISDKSPLKLLIDGKADTRNNSQRWLSNSALPLWIEFQWEAHQTINAARIVSGYRNPGGILEAPLSGFQWQYWNKSSWVDIAGTKVQNNGRIDWSAQFSAITSDKVRLLITASHSQIARIWEIELYCIKK